MLFLRAHTTSVVLLAAMLTASTAQAVETGEWLTNIGQEDVVLTMQLVAEDDGGFSVRADVSPELYQPDDVRSSVRGISGTTYAVSSPDGLQVAYRQVDDFSVALELNIATVVVENALGETISLADAAGRRVAMEGIHTYDDDTDTGTFTIQRIRTIPEVSGRCAFETFDAFRTVADGCEVPLSDGTMVVLDTTIQTMAQGIDSDDAPVLGAIDRALPTFGGVLYGYQPFHTALVADEEHASDADAICSQRADDFRTVTPLAGSTLDTLNEDYGDDLTFLLGTNEDNTSQAIYSGDTLPGTFTFDYPDWGIFYESGVGIRAYSEGDNQYICEVDSTRGVTEQRLHALSGSFWQHANSIEPFTRNDVLTGELESLAVYEDLSLEEVTISGDIDPGPGLDAAVYGEGFRMTGLAGRVDEATGDMYLFALEQRYTLEDDSSTTVDNAAVLMERIDGVWDRVTEMSLGSWSLTEAPNVTVRRLEMEMITGGIHLRTGELSESGTWEMRDGPCIIADELTEGSVGVFAGDVDDELIAMAFVIDELRAMPVHNFRVYTTLDSEAIVDAPILDLNAELETETILGPDVDISFTPATGSTSNRIDIFYQDNDTIRELSTTAASFSLPLSDEPVQIRLGSYVDDAWVFTRYNYSGVARFLPSSLSDDHYLYDSDDLFSSSTTETLYWRPTSDSTYDRVDVFVDVGDTQRTLDSQLTIGTCPFGGRCYVTEVAVDEDVTSVQIRLGSTVDGEYVFTRYNYSL